MSARADALYSDMYGSGNCTPHISFHTSNFHEATSAAPKRHVRCSASALTRSYQSSKSAGGMMSPLYPPGSENAYLHLSGEHLARLCGMKLSSTTGFMPSSTR